MGDSTVVFLFTIVVCDRSFEQKNYFSHIYLLDIAEVNHSRFQ